MCEIALGSTRRRVQAHARDLAFTTLTSNLLLSYMISIIIPAASLPSVQLRCLPSVRTVILDEEIRPRFGCGNGTRVLT